MRIRAVAAGLALAVALLVVLTNLESSGSTCDGSLQSAGCSTSPPAPSAEATAAPSASFAESPSAPPASSAAPTPTQTLTPIPSPAVYTFRDEFNGTRLAAHWGRHWPGIGQTVWSRKQSRVRDGVLTITARRSGSRYVSDLLDTVGTFQQRYGVFSARIRFDEGTGLWPAFWLAQPQNAKHEVAEIDVMEVCANPVGTHDGNDVTLLHAYVHRKDGSHAFADKYRTSNLSGAWHEYTLEWRPDHMTFFFDGMEVYRFESESEISDVKMVVLLNLAVGGRFCGSFTSKTPDSVTMQVDWVRVSP